MMKAMQEDLNVQKQRLADDRQKLNLEKSGFSGQVDALEMKKRDLENDKRRISGFMQIIGQAVAAWR